MEASRIEELRRQGLAAITYTGGVPNPIPCKLIGVEANELLSLIDAIAASEAARAEAVAEKVREVSDYRNVIGAIEQDRVRAIEERDQARIVASGYENRLVEIEDRADHEAAGHSRRRELGALTMAQVPNPEEARLRELALAAKAEDAKEWPSGIPDWAHRNAFAAAWRELTAADGIALIDKATATEAAVAAAVVATREACAKLVHDCGCPDCDGRGYVADGNAKLRSCETCAGIGTLHPILDIEARIRTLDLATISPAAARLARVVDAALELREALREDVRDGENCPGTSVWLQHRRNLLNRVDALDAAPQGPAEGDRS